MAIYGNFKNGQIFEIDALVDRCDKLIDSCSELIDTINVVMEDDSDIDTGECSCQRCGAAILYGVYCTDCAHDILWGKNGTIKSSKAAETAYAKGILDGALKSLVNKGWNIDEFNVAISKGDAEVNDHFRRDVCIGTPWTSEEEYIKRLSKRAIEILNESLSKNTDEEACSCPICQGLLKSKINDEYGVSSSISKKDADFDNIFRWIGEALGFELYPWQKLYLLGDKEVMPIGRGNGKTLAHILRLLLEDDSPISAYNQLILTDICDGDKSNSYSKYFKSILRDTYERLRAHPLLKNKIRKVYFTENQYRLDVFMGMENRQ